MKPNNVIYLKCTEDSFYKAWVEFLTPFHKLTARERDVAARVLLQYDRLKAHIPEHDVLLDVLWSQKSRKDMMKSLGMSQAYFQMVLKKMRDAGMLVGDNNDIFAKYIPHKTDTPWFELRLVLDWSSKENPIRND